jgi:tetratricopeptide (TPR) repeat protein
MQGSGHGAQLSRAKTLIFSVIVFVTLALSLEGLLAAVGVEPLLQREDPYLGFASRIPVFVPFRDSNGAAVMETAGNKLRFFNAQTFDAVKAVDSRRAFCVGGSTTYGRPFDDGTSFCGWLRAMLARLDPAPWEVVNAGGISYASYRAAAVMEELAGYDPDVFVIYTGHNEFLERRTYSRILATPDWLRASDALLRRTRSYSALRGFASSLRERAIGEGRTQLSGEVDTILDRSVGLDVYTRDDQLRRQVLEHLRFNLERMIEIARRAGAEPILVVPASNRRDCSPFKSEFSADTSPEDRDRWWTRFDAGREALGVGHFGDARAQFEQAVVIDPRRADSLFWLGRAREADGDSRAAGRAFDRARDEDVCPLRALGVVAGIVREVAEANGVAVVDFPGILLATAKGTGDPFGEAYFLDHVHPTIEGHRLLAAGIYDAMRSRGLVASAEPGPEDLAVVREEVLAAVDSHKHATALRNLAKVLSWAGKTEDAARAAHLALAELREDAECSFILGTEASQFGRWDEAMEHYRDALRHEPGYTKARNNLGISLARTGRLEEAVVAYERVLRDAPNHRNARFNLANALSRLGRLDAAVAVYLEVLRSDPDDADAHFNLAGAYERRGDYGPAAEHYRAVLVREPEDAAVQRALAEVLRASEQSADARFDLERGGSATLGATG